MCKTYHSTCNKVRNEWSFSPTPAYAFIVWYLLKHRDNINPYPANVENMVSSY